jgi:hypothetical protein
MGGGRRIKSDKSYDTRENNSFLCQVFQDGILTDEESQAQRWFMSFFFSYSYFTSIFKTVLINFFFFFFFFFKFMLVLHFDLIECYIFLIEAYVRMF